MLRRFAEDRWGDGCCGCGCSILIDDGVSSFGGGGGEEEEEEGGGIVFLYRGDLDWFARRCSRSIPMVNAAAEGECIPLRLSRRSPNTVAAIEQVYYDRNMVSTTVLSCVKRGVVKPIRKSYCRADGLVETEE